MCHKHWHTRRFNCNSVTVDCVYGTGSRGVRLHVRTVRQCAWNCGKTRGVATVVNNHVTTAKYGSTTGDVASVFIINTSTYPCWNKIRRMFLLNLHVFSTVWLHFVPHKRILWAIMWFVKYRKSEICQNGLVGDIDIINLWSAIADRHLFPLYASWSIRRGSS